MLLTRKVSVRWGISKMKEVISVAAPAHYAPFGTMKLPQPLAIPLPAAGNRIAGRGQSHCQPRVHRVPAAGNRVPSPWESCSQPLGIVFPAAGNLIPNRRGNFIIAVRQTVSMCCAVSCLHRKICTIALNLLRQAQIAAPAWSVGQCGGGDMW